MRPVRVSSMKFHSIIIIQRSIHRSHPKSSEVISQDFRIQMKSKQLIHRGNEYSVFCGLVNKIQGGVQTNIKPFRTTTKGIPSPALCAILAIVLTLAYAIMQRLRSLGLLDFAGAAGELPKSQVILRKQTSPYTPSSAEKTSDREELKSGTP